MNFRGRISLKNPTSDTLIVALDIGKNVHCVGCYDGRLTTLRPPQELRSDLPGFEQFRALVDPLLSSGRFRQALIGNEPTDVYHEPWAWRIQAAYLDTQPFPTCPVSYHWLNPLLSKRRASSSPSANAAPTRWR